MKNILEYQQIYRLILSDEGYNGMYLGERISPDRLGADNLILVEKPLLLKERFKEIILDFSLIKFKKYRFNEKGKLILIPPYENIYNFKPGEKEYLEELLKKIPKE